MSHDSLFGSDSEDDSAVLASQCDKLAATEPVYVRISRQPPIEGLYIFRNAIPLELQEILLRNIVAEQAVSAQHPQAMLFPRDMDCASDLEQCPAYLKPLVVFLPQVLRDSLPPKDYGEVFDQSMPLQTIINLYEPGQGISPHVDLPHRYANPIIGISLLSSTIMDFLPLEPSLTSHSVLMHPGDVYILLHEARYAYKHGIAYRSIDRYLDEEGTKKELHRGTRLSITLRRMLRDGHKLTEGAMVGQVLKEEADVQQNDIEELDRIKQRIHSQCVADSQSPDNPLPQYTVYPESCG